MSREDANFVIAVATFLIALVAAVASVYAIRRDRAELRVRQGSGAAGTLYMVISNVGLRPVRITEVLVRPSRWRRWLAPVGVQAPQVLYLPDDPDPEEYPPRPDARMRRPGQLPFVLPPAGEVLIGVPTPVLGAYHGVGVEDSSGRRYWLDANSSPLSDRTYVDAGRVTVDGRQHSVGDPAPDTDETSTSDGG